MSGAKDATVATESLAPILEKKAKESGLQYEAFQYDAAHGLLQGAVAEDVQSEIVEILKRPTAAN